MRFQFPGHGAHRSFTSIETRCVSGWLLPPLLCSPLRAGTGGSLGTPGMLSLSTPLCYCSYRQPMASAAGGVCWACSSRLADSLETWPCVCKLLHQVGPERMRAWMRLIGWERGQSLRQAEAKQPLSVFPQPVQMASIGTGLC